MPHRNLAPQRYRYTVFGLTVESDREFRTPMAGASAADPVDLRFRCSINNAPGAAPAPAPGGAQRIYASDEKTPDGSHVLEIYAAAGQRVMRFRGRIDFVLRPGDISCRVYDPSLEYLIEICLFGHVMAYYLELIGLPALHAAAVEADGCAVLFAAEQGEGKSTVVASLVAAGLPLLADDIAALQLTDASVVCRSAFPQLKLTPEQAERFAGGADRLPLVHPGFAKLSVPAAAVGRFSAAGAPVARIYLLDRRPAGGTGDRPSIETVPAAQALLKLVSSAFLAELLDSVHEPFPFAEAEPSAEAQPASRNGAADLRRARFRRLADVLRLVPVRRLRYPSGYQYLPTLVDAVRADLAGDGSSDGGSPEA